MKKTLLIASLMCAGLITTTSTFAKAPITHRLSIAETSPAGCADFVASGKSGYMTIINGNSNQTALVNYYPTNGKTIFKLEPNKEKEVKNTNIISISAIYNETHYCEIFNIPAYSSATVTFK